MLSQLYDLSFFFSGTWRDLRECFILTILLILLIVLNQTYTFSQTANSNKINCNCVIFRLDDIQDKFVNRPQLALMNLFLNKNQSLSLAIIGHYTGKDSSIVNKIRIGHEKGLFELASHGWNHENFSKLSERDQQSLLYKANEKMHRVFGVRSAIFIPPFFGFNNSTMEALDDLGIRMISSFDKYKYYSHDPSLLITNQTNSASGDSKEVLHFPATVLYSPEWGVYAADRTLDGINYRISKYGYAIVILHPQDFAIRKDASFKNSLNRTKIITLEEVIDSIISNNIRITSFYKLSGIPDQYLANQNVSRSNIKNPN